MSKIVSKYSPKDRVYIDGCNSLVAVITAVQWRNENHVNYEVSWFIDGDARWEFIEEWRLSPAEEA